MFKTNSINTGKEIFEYYQTKRDYSGSEQDSYAQELMTMYIHLGAFGDEVAFYDLLKRAHELGKKLTIIYPPNLMISEVTLNMIHFEDWDDTAILKDKTIQNIYLIRHAETQYNKERNLIGGRSSHLPINNQGVKQAEQLGLWLKNNIYFDVCFCSTAVRAKQTLEGILNSIDIPSIEYSEKLEELSQGDWEGKERASVHTLEQLAIINAQNYTFKAPDGESQQEVEMRMYDFIENNILGKDYKNIMVVSHGIAIKCLLRKILDSSPSMTHKIDIDNTGITKISYSNDNGWSLSYVNRIIKNWNSTTL